MKIDHKLHQQIRLQNFLFTLLFLVLVALLGWLSQRYFVEWDWTASGRHSLSEASRKTLDSLKQPLKITVFARENNELRGRIQDLLTPYQHYKPDLTVEFVNPDLHPEQVRQLGITLDGELVIEYQGRSEKIHDLSEQALTNALLRLANSQEQKILFLQGHGERNPKGEANFDLGQWGRTLEQRGLKIETWNLGSLTAFPPDTALVVIASPQVAYLPGEVEAIRKYIDRGGNLLWLTEPGDLKGLQPLAAHLGIDFLPGMIVDTTAGVLGINDPTFVVVASYPAHPLTRNFELLTLFPQAAALEARPGNDFSPAPFLQTQARAWNETGPIKGEIRFDPDQGEKEGPLTFGLSLTRTLEPEKKDSDTTIQQRIAVIGDGDFLSNSYIGNGGNMDLGLNLIQWLNHNESLLDIPAKTNPDTRLELGDMALSLIALGFLILLPMTLFGCGMFIWWRRRQA